jgi:hypothetical protein
MKQSILRALLGGTIGTVLATVWIWLLLVTPGPNDRAGDTPHGILPVLFALVLALVPGALIAGTVFGFSQYPAFVKAPAVTAAVVCAFVSGVGACNDIRSGASLLDSTHVFVWLMLGPIVFIGALWFKVRWAVARRIVDGVTRKNAS